MSVETNNRYRTFDSQLLLGNTGIMPCRRLNQNNLPAARLYTRMRIDGEEYNALNDIRTVRSFLRDMIPTRQDILNWGNGHRDVVEKHQDEYISALQLPSRRESGRVINLHSAISAIQEQSGIIEEVARENLINIMMIRHGFDPKDDCHREKFDQYLLQGSRVADELINEERDELKAIWTRSSIYTLTELQEQVKTDNLYTLIRLATNPNATQKVRQEAVRKAVLIDKAIAAILRIEAANGTIEEVHKVLDSHLWLEEQIGEIHDRGIVMTHDAFTEGCIRWEPYTKEKHGARGSILPSGDGWVQRYYEMPYHQVTYGDEIIKVFMTSRKKEDAATLAKLLLKNGEMPEDVRGIRFGVDNPELAKVLTQLVTNAFDKAGWKLVPLDKDQTLTLTGGFSITLSDGTPYKFIPPEVQPNPAKSEGFGVLQYDVKTEAISRSARHSLHPMSQFEVQVFSIASLMNSQRERDLGDPKPNFHAGYVITKRFLERRVIENRAGEVILGDNYFTQLFSDAYLQRIQRRSDETDEDRQRRISSLRDSEDQPFKDILVEEKHRKIREEEDNRYIPY
ncbi:MAG: hypothetical protein M3Q44_03225 [bacterium]|nr:hypothetical protein [bacterium]